VLHLSGWSIRYKVSEIKLKIRLRFWRICCHVAWWRDINIDRNFLTNCSEQQIGKFWRWGHRTSETSAPMYRSTRPHIPEDRSVNIHCREKSKYDNFRVSAWRHFVALLFTFDYKEKSEQKNYKIFNTKTTCLPERVCQAYTLCSWTPYGCWKSVSGTECVLHEHHTTCWKGVLGTECVFH
jgi:hypothetical protein